MQSLKQGQTQSVRAAAISYDISKSTLRSRINSIPSRCNSIPNSQKLTPIEELAIVRYILNLDSRGFLP
jgi:helix-turn-helix, Psq domain